MDSEPTQPQINTEIKREDSEILSGAEVARRMEFMYGKLDPLAANKLVTAGPVLTVAGLKADGFLYGFPLSNSIWEQWQKLNEEIKDWSLYFKPVIVSKLSNDLSLTNANFYNLKGLERKIAHSPLILDKLGLSPYSANTGVVGFQKWESDFHFALEDAIEEGVFDKDTDFHVMYDGVILGYPDRAILDYERCLRNGGDPRLDLLQTDILRHPFARKYAGEQPTFDFEAESAADPEIVEYTLRAQEVLDGFYSSPWFQKTEKEETFQKAYAELKALREANHKKLNALKLSTTPKH